MSEEGQVIQVSLSAAEPRKLSARVETADHGSATGWSHFGRLARLMRIYGAVQLSDLGGLMTMMARSGGQFLACCAPDL